MAKFSWISGVFLCLLFFALSVDALVNATGNDVIGYNPNGGEGSLRPEECASACDYRCSATSHQKPCLFFCNKCCQKCLCVPSGTYGNKEECPCYDNWKTQEGAPKCP